MKMYLRMNTNFLGRGFQKLEHYRQTYVQSDRHVTETTDMLHSQVVSIILTPALRHYSPL